MRRILYIVGYVEYPIRIAPQLHAFETIDEVSTNNTCDVVGFLYNEKLSVDTVTAEMVAQFPNVRSITLFPRNTGAALRVRQIRRALSLEPTSFARCESRVFERYLAHQLSQRDYDCIHFFGFAAVGQYVRLCMGRSVVITLPDAQSLVYREAALDASGIVMKTAKRINGLLTRRAEKRFITGSVIALAVGWRDSEYLRGFLPGENIRYLPFHIPKECSSYRPKLRERDKGTMRVIVPRPYGSGLRWFLEDVMPILLDLNPSAQVTVLGRDLPVSVDLALERYPNLVRRDWVEDFYEEILEHDVVAIVDRHGTGMSTRALASMALGMPIVGTSIAFRNLPVRSGIDCFVADDAREFAERTVLLLSDRRLRMDIGRQCHDRVVQEFSFQSVMSRTTALYDDMAR